MTPITAILLALCFVGSIAALLVLIRAVSQDQFGGPGAATVIFDQGLPGRVEEPSASEEQLKQIQLQVHGGESPAEPDEDVEVRRQADASSSMVVKYFLASSIFWLLVASVAGVMVAFKFNYPDWLTAYAPLTFGRLRPFHLNTAAYGWISMAGIGIALWMIPRLMRTRLRGWRFAIAGGVLWNAAVFAGSAALLSGWTDGVEWLEFPWQIDMVLALAGALAGVPLLLTIKARQVEHLYVSALYIFAAFLWFPILFVVANFPFVHYGVEHATVNWWFAHNVLGLWLTPLGLAAAYYLIPKVIGKPIHSYQLSLLGFWALALFYSQVGIHHLIGGPVPIWLSALSIVTSVAMVIPVFAVAINHHSTMIGHFRTLLYSPTLRFVVTGAMMYTLVSLQGSSMSLKSLNTITHFTHYTVAHAHMGVYGFVSMIFFGAIYFLLPRVTGREWPSRFLIQAHYWLALIGFGVYFVFLSIGGILQGLFMLDIVQPFMESVKVTLPYLMARSIGGTMMTLAHFVFAYHFLLILWPARQSVRLDRPALKGGVV